MMKRKTSLPTSSTTSRNVTKVPARFDMRTGCALVEQVHQLADLDVERRGAVGHRLHRRLHALDVAAVIGAPDIDHRVEAAAELVAVIGDVGGEIGPRAVGFLEWPVDIVAELGGAEQGLRTRLPIVGQLALWRFEHAGIDEPAVLQNAEALVDRAALDKRALGRRTGRDRRRARRGRRGSAPSSARPRNRGSAAATPSRAGRAIGARRARQAHGRLPRGIRRDRTPPGIGPIVFAQSLAVAQIESTARGHRPGRRRR